MFSRLKKWLYELDDNQLLQDVSNAEYRRRKIEDLRHRRAISLVLVVIWAAILVFMIGSSLPVTAATVVVALGFGATAAILLSIDFQIKPLLVNDKSNESK